MSIGLRIKELRQQKKLSQEEFATSVGIKRANLSQIEAGNQLPTLKILSEIARNYNISYEFLIDGLNKTFGANFNDEIVTQNCNPDCNPTAKTYQTNGAILSEPAVLYQSQQQLIEDQKALIQNYKDIIDYMRAQEGVKEAEIKRLQNEVERLITQIENTKDSGCEKVEECSQKRKAS